MSTNTKLTQASYIVLICSMRGKTELSSVIEGHSTLESQVDIPFVYVNRVSSVPTASVDLERSRLDVEFHFI